MDLTLYNTATRNKEKFSSIEPNMVRMYNCGPTVYNYVHIGNMRAYVFADILRRTLEWNSYSVQQIINITDVGHLVSDSDEGEDKMQVGAKREGLTVEEIIKRYSDAFYADSHSLNIEPALTYPRATNYILEQQQMIETLNEKGYLYTTCDGIYFDTSKFPRYADFAQLDIDGLRAGARVDIGEKRNITDFAVWKFSPDDGVQREQEWDSPLGILNKGFPGWHIECSAIIKSLLGDTIDIHTGGIDHIPIHHTNEIAQSECANDKPFVRYWMHVAFMTIDGAKMSKSLGNTYRLDDLAQKGISPIAYRYWLLTAHYRTTVNFTWEAAEGAQNALNKLVNQFIELGDDLGGTNDAYCEKFRTVINDDLNTAAAVALMWELLKDSSIEDADKRATLIDFDRVLGLGLEKTARAIQNMVLPQEITAKLTARKAARESKDWAMSDQLRNEIKSLGYDVKDTDAGQKVTQL